MADLRITAQQAIDATQGSFGIVTAIASRLGCSRHHVYRLMKKFPTFKAAVLDERENAKDFAESKLFQLIKKDNVTALIFYLKTQAKERGYVERQELSHDGEVTVNVRYIDGAGDGND
jgi:hypothetical protein